MSSHVSIKVVSTAAKAFATSSKSASSSSKSASSKLFDDIKAAMKQASSSKAVKCSYESEQYDKGTPKSNISPCKNLDCRTTKYHYTPVPEANYFCTDMYNCNGLFSTSEKCKMYHFVGRCKLSKNSNLNCKYGFWCKNKPPANITQEELVDNDNGYCLRRHPDHSPMCRDDLHCPNRIDRVSDPSNACTYTHTYTDPCENYYNCDDSECVNTHGKSSTIECKYGYNCTNSVCRFMHPEILQCNFDTECTNLHCKFLHSDGSVKLCYHRKTCKVTYGCKHMSHRLSEDDTKERCHYTSCPSFLKLVYNTSNKKGPFVMKSEDSAFVMTPEDLAHMKEQSHPKPQDHRNLAYYDHDEDRLYYVKPCKFGENCSFFHKKIDNDAQKEMDDDEYHKFKKHLAMFIHPNSKNYTIRYDSNGNTHIRHISNKVSA